jgi:hypothetical protein
MRVNAGAGPDLGMERREGAMGPPWLEVSKRAVQRADDGISWDGRNGAWQGISCEGFLSSIKSNLVLHLVEAYVPK